MVSTYYQQTCGSNTARRRAIKDVNINSNNSNQHVTYNSNQHVTYSCVVKRQICGIGPIDEPYCIENLLRVTGASGGRALAGFGSKRGAGVRPVRAFLVPVSCSG